MGFYHDDSMNHWATGPSSFVYTEIPHATIKMYEKSVVPDEYVAFRYLLRDISVTSFDSYNACV
jgi:hypothetical protein